MAEKRTLVAGCIWVYHDPCDDCGEVSAARCVDCDEVYCNACMNHHQDNCVPFVRTDGRQQRLPEPETTP